MLVILEGCDGSGKTTLAKNLAKAMNAEIIHCNQYTPNNYKFFCDIIESSRERNIIADRFMYGQFVYQEEGERRLTTQFASALENLHKLEAKLIECGGKVVFVTAPIEEIKERLQLRGETLINKLSVETVLSRFKGTFNLSMLTIEEWNTGGEQ